MSIAPRIRSAGRLCLIPAAAFLLPGCWSWIPEEPASPGQAPAAAIPSSAPTPSESSRESMGGAAVNEPRNWYTVEAGDTLFSIAWRFRLQVKDLAAWNQLGDGSLILVGQRIRLTPSPGYAPAGAAAAAASPAPAARPSAAAAPSAPPARPGNWRWPAAGSLDVEGARARAGDFGIRILGTRGQDIMAADGGKVMYAGDGLKAYGLLVIVQHSAQWLSAYGHNERILVKEGDEVRAGQPIATMGRGPGNAAMLHFEIRRNGKPVEPVRLLPRRAG